MRVDRLNQLADALENGLPNVKFDIGRWRSKEGCGVVACVAGHAAILGAYPRRTRNWVTQEDAAKWLELTPVESEELFVPDDILTDSVRRRSLTGPEAARVVRHLARTGEVDWSVARKEGDGE